MSEKKSVGRPSLTKANSILKKENESLKEQIEKLKEDYENRLKELEDTNDNEVFTRALKEFSDEQKKEIKTLTKDRDLYIKLANAAEMEKEEKDDKIRKLINELNALRTKDMTEKDKEIKRLTEQVETLTEDNETLTEDNEQLEINLSNAADDIDILKSENAILKGKSSGTDIIPKGSTTELNDKLSILQKAIDDCVKREVNTKKIHEAKVRYYSNVFNNIRDIYNDADNYDEFGENFLEFLKTGLLDLENQTNNEVDKLTEQIKKMTLTTLMPNNMNMKSVSYDENGLYTSVSKDNFGELIRKTSILKENAVYNMDIQIGNKSTSTPLFKADMKHISIINYDNNKYYGILFSKSKNPNYLTTLNNKYKNLIPTKGEISIQIKNNDNVIVKELKSISYDVDLDKLTSYDNVINCDNNLKLYFNYDKDDKEYNQLIKLKVVALNV